jgi:hypothetical protein
MSAENSSEKFDSSVAKASASNPSPDPPLYVTASLNMDTVLPLFGKG